MRHIVLLTTLFLVCLNGIAQNKKQPAAKTAATTAVKPGYQIQLTLTPLKNQWIYLYNYYGKNFQLQDSAMLSPSSVAVFKGNKKLPGGIYIVVSQSRTRLFDVLMDDVQHFAIKADTSNYENVVITGSKENDLYTAYSKFLAAKAPVMNAMEQQFKAAKNAKDSAELREQLIRANKELNQYRDNVIKEHPTSMLASFFNAMKAIETPAIPVINGKPDSTYPGRYIKSHYWDDVNFADGRLLRTPFFDKKIEDYYKYYVSPEADSIIPEVNFMLLSARESSDMFQYLLGKFTDKYINPEIMGQDKVFIFLFNNFFSKGDTTWLNAKQKEFIFNRAYFLMANQIGEPAAPLVLTDSLNKTSSLYNLQAPFTFVVFWDPNCGHCKETVPRIDSFYRAKWKDLGVKIFSVNVENKAIPEWKKFIREHKLGEGWTHVYETDEQKKAVSAAGQANFRQLYDIYQTPTLYLLDKEKRIIAKKLSLEQFSDVIIMKSKNSSSK